MQVPAIIGIGGSLIYFVDKYYEGNPYNAEFDWVRKTQPAGVGFHDFDHLTHNVHKGNMDVWFKFYGDLFGLKVIRFFDIEGKFTGLLSRALTSPCGRIRIPINEDRGETGQIVEYLKRYNGEGIQHIAVGAHDIYDATDEIASRGITSMKGPPASYYEMSKTRVVGHQEPIDRMMKHGIMMDLVRATSKPCSEASRPTRSSVAFCQRADGSKARRPQMQDQPRNELRCP